MKLATETKKVLLYILLGAVTTGFTGILQAAKRSNPDPKDKYYIKVEDESDESDEGDYEDDHEMESRDHKH